MRYLANLPLLLLVFIFACEPDDITTPTPEPQEGYYISYGGNTDWQFVHSTPVNSRGLLVGDFDGDDSDDLLWATLIGDFNGDGLSDVLRWRGN